MDGNVVDAVDFGGSGKMSTRMELSRQLIAEEASTATG